MNGKELFEAFSYVEDQYLDMIDISQKEKHDMNNKHISVRRAAMILIAAVVCISILAVTAIAAGWIPNIFASIKPLQEDVEVLEAAIAAGQEQMVETVSVPEIDFTKFTLYERYYDGESILLGYDLSKYMPEPIVGCEPDPEFLAQIKEMPEYMHTPYPGMTDDTLELKLELGILTEEEYISILNNRTEYAKQYDLRKSWQIEMDCHMKQELSEEQYEQFWSILSQTGSCCVAIPQKPWVGDHILVNDVDCFTLIGPDCWYFRTDYETEAGDCILLKPLPEAGRNQDSVTVEISLRSGWDYWYMELDGDVYTRFQSAPVYNAVFTLENVNS